MSSVISRKSKIIVILILAVVVAGMVMLGLLGLNNTADYKKSYEVQVGIDQNIDGSVEVVDKAARDYFTSVGVKVSYFATQTLDDGAIYVYKLSSLGDLKEADLLSAVDSAVAASEFSNLEGSVKVYEMNSGDRTEDFLFLLLALGIAVVLIFIYSLISEKVAGGVAALCSAVASAVIFVSLMAILRIPESPFFAVTCSAAIALGAALSIVISNRCRENERIVSEQKLTSSEIASKGLKMSIARLNFMLFGAAVAFVALAVCGFLTSYYFMFAGAQILLATLSAYVSAAVFAPMLWAAVRGGKAKK